MSFVTLAILSLQITSKRKFLSYCRYFVKNVHVPGVVYSKHMYFAKLLILIGCHGSQKAKLSNCNFMKLANTLDRHFSL